MITYNVVGVTKISKGEKTYTILQTTFKGAQFTDGLEVKSVFVGDYVQNVPEIKVGDKIDIRWQNMQKGYVYSIEKL